jgi:hypothetical protein
MPGSQRRMLAGNRVQSDMVRDLRFVSRVFIAVAIVLVAANSAFLIAQFTKDDDGEPGFFVLAPPVIASVTPGGPAEHAGIRPGDRIDFAQLNLHQRLTVLGYQTPLIGERIAIPIVRDNTTITRVVTVGPIRTALNAHTYRIVWAVVALTIIAFGLIVLARRPSIEAIALATFVCVYLGYLSSQYRAPDWFTIGNTFALDVTNGIWIWGAAILALRVTRLSQHKRFLEWLALGVGMLPAGLDIYADAVQIVFARPPNAFVATITQGDSLPLILFFVMVAPTVAIAFVRARGTARVRLRWFALGFGCFTLEVVIALVQNVSPALYGVTWLAYLRPILAMCGMGMLGVAIARDDLFDVGFVVNRATIYAVITGLVVGTFAAVNWLIGSALKSTGLALPIGIVLAGAAAFSLRAIQGRVTVALDRVLFRERYIAERRLARLARAVPLLGDEAALARALIDEPVETLRLSAGALYRRSEEGHFDLVASAGWPSDAPQSIASDDPLVIHATGAPGFLALDEVVPLARFPNGPLRPRTAVTVPGAGGPSAIVLFAAHRTGATLDPDEIAALERIAAASGIAFERLSIAAAQRRLDHVLGALAALHDSLATPPPPITD